MVARLLPRQIATLFLALGVFLSGAAQAHAIPCFDCAPSHSMHMAKSVVAEKTNANSHCASMGMKTAPQKRSHHEGGMTCSSCVWCGVSVDAVAIDFAVTGTETNSLQAAAREFSRHAVGERPALPPPIALI